MDIFEAQALHSLEFRSPTVRRLAVAAILDAHVVTHATCPECGERTPLTPGDQRFSLARGVRVDENMAIQCRCSTTLAVDLSYVVTNAIFHALARAKAYQETKGRLVKLSERLHRDGHEPGAESP